jgi:hypothetical protein
MHAGGPPAITPAALPAGCSRVLVVDDCVDTGATAEAVAAALREAAGRELIVEVVAVSLCVNSRLHVANSHLPQAAQTQLIAALDADDADNEPGLKEGEQAGIVYRCLNYGGSTVRAVFRPSGGWTPERMCKPRQRDHNRCLDKGNHPSRWHQKEAGKYKEQHGGWPPLEVVEVLYSRAQARRGQHSSAASSEASGVGATVSPPCQTTTGYGSRHSRRLAEE